MAQLPRDRAPAAAPPEGGRTPLTLPIGIRRADVPEIVARADQVLERARPGALVCDAGNDRRPDLATVDLLARLALAARRHGATVRIDHASPELLELLGLCGFEDVLEIAVEPPEAPGPTAADRTGRSDDSSATGD